MQIVLCIVILLIVCKLILLKLMDIYFFAGEFKFYLYSLPKETLYTWFISTWKIYVEGRITCK